MLRTNTAVQLYSSCCQHVRNVFDEKLSKEDMNYIKNSEYFKELSEEYFPCEGYKNPTEYCNFLLMSYENSTEYCNFLLKSLNNYLLSNPKEYEEKEILITEEIINICSDSWCRLIEDVESENINPFDFMVNFKVNLYHIPEELKLNMLKVRWIISEYPYLYHIFYSYGSSLLDINIFYRDDISDNVRKIFKKIEKRTGKSPQEIMTFLRVSKIIPVFFVHYASFQFCTIHAFFALEKSNMKKENVKIYPNLENRIKALYKNKIIKSARN